MSTSHSYITTYNPLPITFSHGEGIWLYDESGKAYLDATSGIAVCNLGHAHPLISETIAKQAKKLIHTSNMFHIKEQELLAEELLAATGLEQAFFCNSGAEANETAIKLTRLFGHKKNIEKPSIIVMEGAFHGRTMATLSASGSRRVQAGFEPFVPGFIRAPFNNMEALHTIAANRDDVVAIMLEPIQGEGGVFAADEMYLRGIKQLCQTHDWLLILDEVQTGNGRLGKLFAFMEYGFLPDVLTTAKGLGNGFPIGACLMSDKACNLLKPGNHGSTFGGNPLACATARTVLHLLQAPGFLETVTQNSIYLKDQLIKTLGDHPNVRAIRGKGYLLGVELDRNAMDIRAIGLEQGILLNVTTDTVVRLLPPLIMTKADIDEMVSRLVKTIAIYTETR